MSEHLRVVVTGVGLVSPVGIGTEETWEALLEGKSGIAPIQLFDPEGFACRFAGEVKDFQPESTSIAKTSRRWGDSFSSRWQPLNLR
jgi:3-oxoacyl-[acyl-carrier-protein] synthase II